MIKTPKIPSTIINMNCAFAECTSLKVAPVIPENVTNCSKLFCYCANLNGKLILNANVTENKNWNSILWGAVSEAGCTLKLYGTCPELNIIAYNYNSFNPNISLGD